MKLVGFIVVFIYFQGCSSHTGQDYESQKVYEFVNWLLALENLSSDSGILILEESNNSWAKEYLGNPLSISELRSIKGLSKKELSSFLTTDDWDKILAQSSDRFFFDSTFWDDHVVLLSKEQVKMIKSNPVDFQGNADFIYSGKYSSYTILSKPIFFHSDNYAVIYIETGLLDLMDGSRGLAFSERVNGQW